MQAARSPTGRVRLQAEVAEQRGAEVSFAEAAHDGDDPFALHFGACGDLSGRAHVGSAADPRDDAFFFGQSTAPGEGVFVIDLNDVVDDGRVQVFGDEPGSDALDSVLAGRPAADDGGVRWFNGERFEVRILLLEEASGSRDRAAGSDSGNDGVDLVVAVGPNLRPGGGFVNGRVGRVFELLRHERVVGFVDKVLRGIDGAFHAVSGGCQDEVRAHRSQQRASFDRHGFGHCQRELVAFGGTNECQCDPCISAGRFDDVGVGVDVPVTLTGFDHRDADPVLDAVERLEELTLRKHGRAAGGDEAIDLHHRCVTNRASDVVEGRSTSHEISPSEH